MGKIVMSGPQNVSLDGVVQDPDGAEGFPSGGWFTRSGGADLQEWAEVALDEARGAAAWLRHPTCKASGPDRIATRRI